MPIILLNIGEKRTIRKIGGNPQVKKHLENLGFVTGGDITIVSKSGGNLIVNVKETRIAISSQ